MNKKQIDWGIFDNVDKLIFADQFYPIRVAHQISILKVSHEVGIPVEDIERIELQLDDEINNNFFIKLAEYYKEYLDFDINEQKRNFLNCEKLNAPLERKGCYFYYQFMKNDLY